MSYYFVNNRYPVSDPNMDLNFNNDILYQNILGDEAMVAPQKYANADEVPKRSRRPDNRDIRAKAPGYNIALCFIMIVILVVIMFYMIHQNKQRVTFDNRTIRIPQTSAYGGAPQYVVLGPGEIYE